MIRLSSIAAMVLLLSLVAQDIAEQPVAAQPEASPAPMAPGALVRWEPIPPIGTHPAWRILYTSTERDGSVTAITGIIAIPDQPVPDDGFPLLVVAHPTAGLGRQCAPSLLLQSGGSLMADLYEQILTPYLDAGFAIVMSDYQGLGAAGDPSYLIGAIEGRNLLDSAHAARQFPETSFSGQTLLIGHSQGGHAVAFALQIAPDYAPDLSIDGAVLAAPALDPRGIFDSLIAGDSASEDTSLILFVMAAWSASYPGMSLDAVVTPLGRELIESSIADGCLIEAGLAAADYQPSDLFLPGAADAWADIAAENTPAPGPWSTPVLIVHGTEDEVIDLQLTTDFVDNLCASGTVVQFVEFPGVDHFGILSAAGPDMVTWLQQRLTQPPPTPTCQ